MSSVRNTTACRRRRPSPGRRARRDRRGGEPRCGPGIATRCGTGPRPRRPILPGRQIGHQAGIHVQRRSSCRRLCLCGQVAHRGVTFLRLGVHRHLVAEGRGHVVIGRRWTVPVSPSTRIASPFSASVRDPLGLDHQRDRERAGDDGRVAADRALFQHHAAQRAAVFQKLARPDVAGDEDRVLGQRRAGLGGLGRSGCAADGWTDRRGRAAVRADRGRECCSRARAVDCSFSTAASAERPLSMSSSMRRTQPREWANMR
jgi:hypothetical protein